MEKLLEHLTYVWLLKIAHFADFCPLWFNFKALNSGYKTPACGDFCYRILIRTNWILIFPYFILLLSSYLFFHQKRVEFSFLLLNFFFSPSFHTLENREWKWITSWWKMKGCSKNTLKWVRSFFSHSGHN